MAETKRKSARRPKRSKIDGGRAFVMLMLTIFFVVGAAFIANSVYHLATATRPNDGIAFAGGFGAVFLIMTLFMASHLLLEAPADRPLIIGAIAISGFLLGLAGLALYYYARITPAGIFASFLMGGFLLILAWQLWKNYVKQKYG